MLPYDPSPSPLIPPPSPPLTEERFMDAFRFFSDTTGVRLSEHDFLIDGRQVNPWELHKIVFARNGFDSVTANGEWSMVGVEIGFPPVTWGDSPQVAHCTPAVAHQLHQLYQDTLRYFDKAYSCGIIAQMRNSQAPNQVPSLLPQPPAQPLAHKTTEADYQALLANTISDSSVMTFEAMSILPRFWDIGHAELEARGVPQRLIRFIEQNREQLKLLAQFRTPTESRQLVPQNQLSQASGLQTVVHSPLQYYQQRQHGELMRGGVPTLSLPQQQLIQALRAQVAQGNVTPQQAMERVSIMQANAVHPFQEQSVPQHFPPGFNAGGVPNGTTQQQLEIATLSQAHARQFSMLLPQGQQQQSGSGLASRMGQIFNPPGIGFPQGTGSLQPNFIQPSPLVPHANVQTSSAPSASQPPLLGAQQACGPSGNLLAGMPLPQLRALSSQLLRIVMEGEKSLQITSGSDESDIQWQLRAKVENNKRYLLALQEVINAKMKASGDPTQQAVNGTSWPGPGQRPADESANGLPPNGVLAQINGAPLPSPQITHPPSQQPIQPNKLPFLPEDRFKRIFVQFTRSKGITLSDRDIVVDGRSINLWALHRAVFSLNGFESVSARDEWPIIGAALGFPQVAGGDANRPPRCGPVIAHQLQQLYNNVLRLFDQVYISNILARLRSSQAGQLPQPPQSRAHLHQPTEADYQALLASVRSESSVMNAEAMSILPRFSNTSGADLEAHHVPQHVIAFVEQNREHLQRAAQDQSRFRVGLTSTDAMQIRRPTREDLIAAKRWVDEEKRIVFGCAPDFSRVTTYPVTESDLHEYRRNLERLDQVLATIDKYIYVSFAVLKKQEVFERIIEMMASVKVQIEEINKPNPRYVLELQIIRGMIQEADNMDKGLKAVLHKMRHMPHDVPSAPQSPLLSMGILPPSTQLCNPDPQQGDESTSSPEGVTTYREGLFDEEVRIAMSKLEI